MVSVTMKTSLSRDGERNLYSPEPESRQQIDPIGPHWYGFVQQTNVGMRFVIRLTDHGTGFAQLRRVRRGRLHSTTQICPSFVTPPVENTTATELVNRSVRTNNEADQAKRGHKHTCVCACARARTHTRTRAGVRRLCR
jgi:hypothetical protein